MFTNLRKRWSTSHFNRLTRAILDTPPMPVIEANCSIISMVRNDDVQMYLLAMKSFYSRIRKGKITAIIDRDMPESLRAILTCHLPGIRFAILEDIDTGICQRGGTWERLVYLLDQADEEYAIQVDCDTLTIGADLDEINRCVERNVAFTLSNSGRPIKTMSETVMDGRQTGGDHITIVTEHEFKKYPGAAELKYVRASSGLAGFAKGSFPRAKIEEFHRNMENLLGADWRKWGTEQCASNFAVANSPGAVVLPYPKYANFWSGMSKPNTFLHFIGSNRYDEGYYASRALETIRLLKEPQTARV